MGLFNQTSDIHSRIYQFGWRKHSLPQQVAHVQNVPLNRNTPYFLFQARDQIREGKAVMLQLQYIQILLEDKIFGQLDGLSPSLVPKPDK